MYYSVPTWQRFGNRSYPPKTVPMSTQQSVDSQTIEQTKQQLRGLVQEIAQLSKMNLTEAEYYHEFLQRVVTALAAVGGAVWTRDKEGRLMLTHQINYRQTSLHQQSDEQVQHTRLLHRAFQNTDGMLVLPNTSYGKDEKAANPTPFLLVLAPLMSDSQIEGVVEIFQRANSTPNTQRGYLRFLMQMSELVGEWLKSNKLRQLGDQQSLLGQVNNFSRSIHESLDLRQTAYVIANEGRQLIGCDRLSVAVRKGMKCHIEAVSGQDTVDNRSNVIVMLSRLATKIVATGENLWYSGATQDLPPQIEHALDEYIDESHSKTIAVIPVRRPVQAGEVEATRAATVGEDSVAELETDGDTGEIIGALIVEQIEDSRTQAQLAQRVDLVREHSLLALSNAVTHHNLFLMPLWRTLGKAEWLVRARNLPKTVAATVAIIGLLIMMSVFPWDFNLKGSGVMQPVERRDVFVDQSGIVAEVKVSNGEKVVQGQVLAIIESTELEIEAERIIGNLASVREQLLSARKTWLSGRTSMQRAERLRIESQIAELTQQELSLKKQYDLILEKRKQLTVLSPMEGEVVTWNVKELLERRPVTIGQVLMTLANPNNAWELEVQMPEKRMGHVAKQLKEYDGDIEKLKVTYIAATNPDDKLTGKVTKIHRMAELDEDEGHSVLVKVNINRDDIPDEVRRPGATVTAKIYCGKRPIGYVWIHELIETIQSRVFF